jgi:hypothetical protein
MLEVSKIFDKARTNPRLFTQLMFILLFNVPQNEEIMYRLIKKQMASGDDGALDFSKLDRDIQQRLYLNGLRETRYKAYDWFRVI